MVRLHLLHLGSLWIGLKLLNGSEIARRGQVLSMFRCEPIPVSYSTSVLIRKRNSHCYSPKVNLFIPWAWTEIVQKHRLLQLLKKLSAACLHQCALYHLQKHVLFSISWFSFGFSQPPCRTGARHLLPPVTWIWCLWCPSALSLLALVVLIKLESSSGIRWASSGLKHMQ